MVKEVFRRQETTTVSSVHKAGYVIVENRWRIKEETLTNGSAGAAEGVGFGREARRFTGGSLSSVLQQF